MKREIIIPILISIISIVLFWMVSERISSVVIFIPGIIISLIIYFMYNKSIIKPSSKFVTLYLVLISIQLIHFAEEYQTGFIEKLPALIGQSPYPENLWVTFNVVAYAVFVLGAIAVIQNLKAFLIIPIFFITIGVLFNGIAHVGLSIYSGGYFPGLITAILYIILGPYAMRFLVKQEVN